MRGSTAALLLLGLFSILNGLRGGATIEGFELSKGGEIAILVVACIIGVILFYDIIVNGSSGASYFALMAIANILSGLLSN
jgi:hypothetical protein